MSNEISVDVAIIGGGPAGAATALALLAHSDATVAVVENTAYDRVRIGEHVAASLLPLLEYLKVEKPCFAERALPVYNFTAAWGGPRLQSRDSLFSQFGETYQLDRKQFDQMLARQVCDKGGIIYPRAKPNAFKRLPDGGWRVSVTHVSGKTILIKARFLVDATGRCFHVSRKLAIDSYQCDALMGVGAFLRVPDEQALEHKILIESVEQGWWYSAKLPGGLLSVVLFTDADIVAREKAHKAENWNRFLNETTYTREQAAGSVAYGKPWVRDACSHMLTCAVQKNWLAVGDAASSYDPISSMGIGFAISSACHAARAALAQIDGDPTFLEAYQQGVKDNFSNYLAFRKRYYQAEQRWPKAPFWQRRHKASDPRQFQDSSANRSPPRDFGLPCEG